MFINYLNQEFARRQNRNANYSLRAFAKSIGVDHSTLAKLLKRTRKITPTQALKIVRALDVDAAMKSLLLLAVIENRPPAKTDKERFEPIDDTHEGVEYWEFYAVLSLLEIPKSRHDVKWLSKKLGSTEERVEACLRGLETAGYLSRENKPWSLKEGELRNRSPATLSRAIRRAQEEYIRLGLKALDHPLEERDINGATIAIARERVPEAWELIRQFRRRLCDHLAAGEKDAVYRINIQLFRLDRGLPGEER